MCSDTHPTPHLRTGNMKTIWLQRELMTTIWWRCWRGPGIHRHCWCRPEAMELWATITSIASERFGRKEQQVKSSGAWLAGGKDQPAKAGAEVAKVAVKRGEARRQGCASRASGHSFCRRGMRGPGNAQPSLQILSDLSRSYLDKRRSHLGCSKEEIISTSMTPIVPNIA